MQYADYAKKFIGVKEGSQKHIWLVEQYNKIKPLPRHYRVKISDSWCAVFVSVILKKCKSKNAYECSASNMYYDCMKKGYAVKKPKKNDLIFYNFTGRIDHVGIISKVDGNTIYTIEGNYSDKVKQRKISKTNKNIVGFCRVPKRGD